MGFGKSTYGIGDDHVWGLGRARMGVWEEQRMGFGKGMYGFGKGTASAVPPATPS